MKSGIYIENYPELKDKKFLSDLNFDEFIKNGCDVVGVINYDLVFSRSYMVHITGFTLMFAGILATDTMFINIDDGLFTIRLDMERGDDNV